METRVVRKGDDLYMMSGKLDAYAKGHTVVELNAKDGYGKVVFENGKELVPGKALGNVSEARLRRIQIREAIKAHLQKESQLFAQGIKVLTLFFIDEVAKYRVYGRDDTGTAGEYAKESDSIAELPESLKEIEKWREPLIQLVSSVYDKSAVKRGMLARQPKISYAEKHFKALSGGEFKYHVVTSYDDLLKECVGGR